MPRAIAIGDIHGHATALKALVLAIQPQPDDTLVLLGDYVDRGPDSRSVLDELIKLSHRHNVVALRPQSKHAAACCTSPQQYTGFVTGGSLYGRIR